MQDAPIAVVTGANGFVGSHLIDFLLEKGWKLRGIVRSSSWTGWLDGKDIELHRCGLADADALVKVFAGAEYVFHIAGVVKSKKKEGFYKGNVDTTERVMQAASRVKGIKRIMITSSLAATGPSDFGEAVDERTPCEPINAYGESKLAQEQMAKRYAEKHQLPITIVRPPAVYGPRDGEILLFFKTIKQGLSTEVGRRSKELSLVHVRDLVRGMYLATTRPEGAGETYFLGSEKQYTWTQLGKLSAKLLDKKPFTLRLPHWLVHIVSAVSELGSTFSKKAPTLNLEKMKEIRQAAWTCDSSKARQELGYYENPVPFEAGIRDTLEWYKEKGWL